MKKIFISELIGTMILILVGCGAAVIAGDEIGLVGISFAFGLSIIVSAYSIGNISGAHLNPAVSLAMLIVKRIDMKNFITYVIAQISGAFLGTIILKVLVPTSQSLASNIIMPEYNLIAVILFETIFTMLFVLVILFVTNYDKFSNVAGIVIGLSLTAIHLVGIPISNTSVNPARSLAPAFISMDPDAVSQVWIFIVFPLLGALIASLIFKVLVSEDK